MEVELLSFLNDIADFSWVPLQPCGDGGGMGYLGRNHLLTLEGRQCLIFIDISAFDFEGPKLPYFWLLEGVMEAGSTRTLLSRGTSSERLPIKEVRSVIFNGFLASKILNKRL